MSVRLNLELLRRGVRAAFPIDEDVPLPEDATLWEEVPEMPGRLLVSLDTETVTRTLYSGSVWQLVGYPPDGGTGNAEWRVTLFDETVYGPVRGDASLPPREAVAFLEAAAELADVRLVGQLAP